MEAAKNDSTESEMIYITDDNETTDDTNGDNKMEGGGNLDKSFVESEDSEIDNEISEFFDEEKQTEIAFSCLERLSCFAHRIQRFNVEFNEFWPNQHSLVWKENMHLN